MDFLTLDMETYYGQDYTLSNMTTEAYVRDPRFEEILCSFKFNDTKAFWLLPDRADDFIRREIDWVNTILCCHHSHFDGLILSHHHGVKPAMHIDTLSMARVLDGPKAGNSLHDLCIRHGIGSKGDYVTFAKGKHLADFNAGEIHEYGKYGVNDVEKTYLLAQLFLDQMPAHELQIIDLVIRCFTEPVFVADEAKLRGAVVSEKQRKIDMLRNLDLICPHCNGAGCKKCDDTGVDKKTIGSNEKLVELFRALGAEPGQKRGKDNPDGTPKMIWAFAKTDPAMQELLEDEDEAVRLVAEARIAVKSSIIETRAERFADMASRGTMPVYISYGAAHTFRMGGGDKCLVADTMVVVFDPIKGVTQKRIVDILIDDLVWDGEEFVPHGGVKFSGYAEVISHNGVTGTEAHVVFTKTDGEITLAEAASRGSEIMDCPAPTDRQVEAVERSSRAARAVRLPMR